MSAPTSSSAPSDPRALRPDGRSVSELRPVSFMRDFTTLEALSLEISGHYRSSDESHIADLALALSKLAGRVL